MAKSPSEVLTKMKAHKGDDTKPDNKKVEDDNYNADSNGSGKKKGKKSALLVFIEKNKKTK